ILRNEIGQTYDLSHVMRNKFLDGIELPIGRRIAFKKAMIDAVKMIAISEFAGGVLGQNDTCPATYKFCNLGEDAGPLHGIHGRVINVADQLRHYLILLHRLFQCESSICEIHVSGAFGYTATKSVAT